jgi:hypothetical protein
MESFFNLKRDLILSDKTLKPQIDILEGDLMFTTFGYSIQISASTVGEVIKLTLKINKEFDDRINMAVERGIKYINLVAQGAFQIDVSKFFSNNNKNSKV